MALRFDASGEYLTRSMSGLGVSATAFTITGVTRINADIGGATTQSIVCFDPDGTVYFNWDDSGSGMALGSYDGSTDNQVLFTARPAVGERFFWYVKCSGSGTNQLEAGWMPFRATSITESKTTTLTATPTLGTLYVNTDAFAHDSRADHSNVRVWSSALSGAQILAEAASASAVVTSGLVIDAPMTGATVAAAVADTSGGGHDFTAVGTLATTFGPNYGALAYREHWSAEGLSEVTVTSSTSYSDVVTLTIPAADQDASSDYVVFWSANAQINSTIASYNLRLTQDGTQVVLLIGSSKEAASPIDYHAQGGLYKFTSASTPVDVVLKIQIAGNTATGTNKAKNGRITAFKLGADDEYAESTGRTTTTSATLTNSSGSLSFTPATAGDYVILLSASLDNAKAASSSFFAISDGTDTSYEAGAGVRAARDKHGFAVAWPRTGVSGAKTYTAQYRSKSGGTAGIQEIRLLALRVDGFDNIYTTTLGSDNSGTQTTYQTSLTQTFIPAANDHLSFAAWPWSNSSTSVSSYSQFIDDGTTVIEAMQEANAASDLVPGWAHCTATYTAAARTQTIQRKSETTSATTAIKTGATIVTLDFGAVPAGGSPYTLTASTRSYVLTGTAVSLYEAKRMPANTASYALTGTAAITARGKAMPAATAAYAMTGTAASVLEAKRLVGATASYALTGTASTLTYTPVGSSTLTAASVSYSLTGSAVAFRRTRIMSAATASYALTGTADALKVGRRLVATTAGYSLAGAANSMSRGRTLVGATRSYALTGTSVAFKRTYKLGAESGAYVYSGSGVVLINSADSLIAYPIYGRTLSAAAITQGGPLIASPLAASTLTANPL